MSKSNNRESGCVAYLAFESLFWVILLFGDFENWLIPIALWLALTLVIWIVVKIIDE